MYRRISQVFINDLLACTDIVHVIGNRINLQKKGKNFYACCPFHIEEHASFVVNNEKQFYYCFGCGSRGNAIDFLMHYDRLNFIETIEELAINHGLNIIYEKNIPTDINDTFSRQSFYDLMKKIATYYQYNLNQELAIHARKYINSRGFTKEITNDFMIGYALPGWQNLIKHFAISNKQINLLMKLGMIVKNAQNKLYDIFRDRIIFPIRDKRGRIISFGGRAIRNNIPKYLNSPDSEIFHKRYYLYGLYEINKHHDKKNCLLLVEGYTDVVTLAQFGIHYSVATLGTATTGEQIQLLFRYTDTIICCYDGDNAGYNAAWCTLKKSLSHMKDGRQMRFMFLPKGEDPDSLIRKEGKTAFEVRLKKAIPFCSFMFNRLISQVDLNTVDGKAHFSMLAIPLIIKVPGSMMSIYLRQEFGKKVGILNDSQLDKVIFLNKKINNVISPTIKHTTMRLLIALLLQNPTLSRFVPNLEKLKKINLCGLSLFIDIVKICNENPTSTTAQLIEIYRGTNFMRPLEILASWNHMVVDEAIEKVFQDALTNLYDTVIKHRLEKLIARSRIKILSAKDKHELWSLNQALSKKINI
ncbi:DNA primase [Candidatus Ishikawella capsulata]|uniref:DNA primase n=1 Tax=Candidatus Ishikawaella capsulata Mpkobe TaxID=476281 RepID=C5WDL0_9ENTR|nr:DNA primase [Candidatus Ishikawaella capsulata]BAH83416.1 DNA primase [Candidatus Ishikawaella capsulata Mpkobe]